MKGRPRTSSHRSSTPAVPPRGVLAGFSAWWAGSRAVNLFTLKFVAIVAAFHALTLLPVYAWLLPSYLHTVALLAQALSRCFGEVGEVVGATLRAPAYAVTVSPACSAVELAGFIVAAVLAFPSPWRAKVSGVVLGMIFIAGLNVARVTSLFLVGLHARASFDMVHDDLWAVLFILGATFFVGLWIARVQQRNTPRPLIDDEHA